MKAHQLKMKFQRQGLLEEIINIQNLLLAFKAIKRNKGAPGIDNITIEMYEEDLHNNLNELKQQVEGWKYKPTPVKRVEIPKPNGKGMRLLGIPIIKDRVLHMAIKQVLEPILDPTFSQTSFGFRPGRNQEQAVKKAQTIINSGKPIVVDIDLSKFFDRINHDKLIHRLGNLIDDKRVLRLIGNILRSGIMNGQSYLPSNEGSVQGSPLSPLLSNLVLDELDKELESRGLEFCRYADDCNIFVKTQRAGERVMQSIKRFIEKKLKLKINEDKSQVADSKKVKFLGMTIANGFIAISKSSMNKAMETVKQLTPRGTHKPIEKAIEEINQWFTGWSSYYKMTQYPAQLLGIEAHIRRRLRARLCKQQKRRRNLANKLIKRGVNKKSVRKAVYSNKKWWKLSHTRAVEKAYSNKWFICTMGQKIKSNLKLFHWLPIKEWVKLT